MSRRQFSCKSYSSAFAPEPHLGQDLKETGYLSGPNGRLGSVDEYESEEEHLMAHPEGHYDEDEQLTAHSDDVRIGNKDITGAAEEKRELHGDELPDSAEAKATNSVDTVEVSDVESTPDSVNSVEISDLGGSDDTESEGSCTSNMLPETGEPLECSTVPGNQESYDLSKEITSSQVQQHPDKENETAEEDLEVPQGAGKELCHESDADLEHRFFQESSIIDTGYLHCRESALENRRPPLGADHTILPLLFEECPYDVIGPPCDPDPPHSGIPFVPSGNSCKSEDTWDNFQPYSVIESVPADEVNIISTGNPHKGQWTSEEQGTADICKLEPCYVSSNDVDEIEGSHAHSKQCTIPKFLTVEHPDVHCLNTCEEMPQSKDDDYADIEEAGDLDQLECPSSEDYVEIGDDDETADIDPKRIQKDSKQTEKPCLPLLNHRSSQPRFRLCAITVPADMDLSGTEHTNRLVFADTSDALEDDIDAEGHIVPYFEDSDTERDNISDEHVYEEAGLESEGENFLSLGRKSIVTRSRSLSGKVPGYVPETVPEEPGIECQTHDYYTVSMDENHDPRRDAEQVDVNRMAPSSKPWRFNLYPRSFSLEGRDMPMNVYRETDCPLGEEGRMKRMDDTLSLPCVIGSSGSFSQRSHQASSGMSTPTSVVDIPPPFELAYITKKPITKSSPSLLIENDLPEKQKKKKSSFKRFLALKFKRKKDNKVHLDLNSPPSRSSSESSHHGPFRIMDMDRRSVGSSPQSHSRSGKPKRLSDDSITTFLFYNDGQTRKSMPKTTGNRVSRVESFEDRSRPPFMPLPLTKPRSISFPSADTSDYENIPAISSDYENIQIPPRRPIRMGTFTDFFDDPSRAPSSANENDGYVDMSSLTGFESKTQTPDQESESAYTEPYKVCPTSGIAGEVAGEEDHGRTSEEEDGCVDHGFDRHIDGRSRAYYIAKQLVDSEKLHVRGLRLLHEGFRAAVREAQEEDGQPALEEDCVREILSQLPEVYRLHCDMAAELEDRIAHWEESPRITDVILSRRAEFSVFTTYVNQYDRNMALLEDCRKRSPAFSSIVRQFEHQSPVGGNVPMKHQLLQVIIRVLQYRMLLTDYLNNLSPDSQEYEDTQAALVIVSDVADQANDSLRQGENLLRLVNIEYSVGGQRDLLRPGRVFVKEGTLMKVSRKSRQPRHLFLMNDLMLYTYPQQDGKYRLKNTLSLTGMRVSKPAIENVQNALKIEVADICITLSASSCGEREDWFHTLSRTVAEHARGLGAFGSSSSETREKLWVALGEKAPTLVPMSSVTMCMSCTTDFSLTLRRHHCQGCGKAVCRSCARNKYPLKYLKDRMGKVCDHCYAELKKRDGNADGGHVSPQPCRSSRPLSAVFQNIYSPSLWRTRRSIPNLSQVPGSAEGSTMSGSLQRRKRSKRNWKKLWFLIKDKVLYTFSTREDKVASESLPLQGFTVKLPEKPEGDDTANIFQLYHRKTLYYTFRAEDTHTAHRWVSAMEEATVL
ncbi:FYVE, RhoGEF and PH domain-containing protein 5-like isoform X1 [Scleropages formosus]|uniref:FYVE, RhoGEF and PH domain containing 5a n=1 Tax=Scleropages formosus TaxID=113540 RepID=A0A8C9SIN7_SCLFO|nr:FYVE, RhoGEF and PH domain-containing protein 5 isoform X1 [Scleropages formosus]